MSLRKNENQRIAGQVCMKQQTVSCGESCAETGAGGTGGPDRLPSLSSFIRASHSSARVRLVSVTRVCEWRVMRNDWSEHAHERRRIDHAHDKTMDRARAQ